MNLVWLQDQVRLRGFQRDLDGVDTRGRNWSRAEYATAATVRKRPRASLAQR